MSVNRLRDQQGRIRRSWLVTIVGVALGVVLFGATAPSVTLAQSDDASVQGLIDQIFAEAFGGGGPADESEISGGDINVGGSMGSTVTMGGGSSGGISIGGGSGGSGSGGISSGPYSGE